MKHPMLFKIFIAGWMTASAVGGTVIGNETTVPIGFAVGAIGMSCGWAWWLSRWFQRIEGQLTMQDREAELQFNEVHRRLDSLPCESRKCKHHD